MKWSIPILLLLTSGMALAENAQTNMASEISKHYSAEASLYDFANINKEQLSDKITRQYVMGSQSMLVKWTLKKGAIIPLHFHPNEQITWITSGSVKVASQGKIILVKAGGTLIIPPYVPHEFTALEDTIDIDFFTPVREDWLNNSASYLQGISKKN
jgi:quercetin dioxygenase-like cupin family protein